tara:strand:- start:717 stop:899 length:183 start_codon:yes stop_codon:yes gene_type:complete
MNLSGTISTSTRLTHIQGKCHRESVRNLVRKNLSTIDNIETLDGWEFVEKSGEATNGFNS